VLGLALLTDRSVVDRIASAAVTCPVRAAEIAMHSAGAPGAIAAQMRAAAATVGPQASPPAAEAAGAVAAAGGAGKPANSGIPDHRSVNMKSAMHGRNPLVLVLVICATGWAFSFAFNISAAQHTSPKSVSTSTPPASPASQAFDTPQAAADALVKAAGTFDEHALYTIFGPKGIDIAFTGETALDRKHALDFAAQAREQLTVSEDPKTGTRAFLLVGNDQWPFPVPLVKSGNKWFFDAKAGRQELLYRRIGANELDAIDVCRGYVEAQEAYALQARTGYAVNQYAQRIVSTPGKQDGLAWQNDDGSWHGPIGQKIAQAIEQGYNLRSEPYHGYFFKILTGQGPAAPLGQMNFVVKGLMIGGFALVAAPAEYGVTGVQTFIVSDDGVVYQKDLGPKTIDVFTKMELFNPDLSWTPVLDDQDNSR
jgi:hypothetical protein